MEDLSALRVPALLDPILEQTNALHFSMSSEPLVGALLRALAASRPDGRFLELGTGTGISTTWLLDGMSPSASLVSIDTDAAAQRVAHDNIRDSRLTLLLEDGLAFLERQAPASYDLVFADAMPGKYEGLELALAIVRPGGFYVIDDMLPQSNWPTGHAARIPVLIDKLASHPDFVIAPLVWASGVVLAVRKG